MFQQNRFMKIIIFGIAAFFAGLFCGNISQNENKKETRAHSNAEDEIMNTIDCIERNIGHAGNKGN